MKAMLIRLMAEISEEVPKMRLVKALFGAVI